MNDRIFWWETPTKQYGTQTITTRTDVPFDVELEDIYFDGNEIRYANGNFMLRSQNGGYTELPPHLDILVTMTFTNPTTSYQQVEEVYINTDECELDENGYIVGLAGFGGIELSENYFDFGNIQYDFDWEQPYYETTEVIHLVPKGDVQFGEDGFNSGFTVDGTKDSSKISMFSLTQKSAIKPYSIVYHENTNTWWIVASDRVERLENEQGYVYKHNLQLEGAIELLNARDLTDCGFNQNTYTIEQFVKRLFELSNFEFKGDYVSINVGNNMDLTEKIDYVKTYENYTLLSAIRDFFDGYNCAAKLTFNMDSSYNLTGCSLNICPKNGNIDLPVLDLDTDFNDKNEQRKIHKNSYGTTVVSNTDNVVSTITKTFPSVGGVKLSSNAYQVTASNAVIKLPSKVFSVQEVKMYLTIRFALRQYYGGSWHYEYQNYGGFFNVSDTGALRKAMTTARNYMATHFMAFDNAKFGRQMSSMIKMAQLMGTITFNSDATYNPQSKLWVANSSQRVRRLLYTYGSATRYWVQTVVADKDTGNAIAGIGTPESGALYSRPDNVFKFERGSDEISGFNMMPCDVRLIESDYGKDSNILFSWNQGGNACQFIVAAGEKNSGYEIYANTFTNQSNQPHKVLWGVKYTPMTDLKIKLDNRGDDNNTHLYNQNGKLTDINAFSKMLNSYKQEIEGENITKYAVGYDLSAMPQVGQIVNGDGHKYVINSVSLNFFQNEESNGGAYFIVGEYSLSEYAAVKSLLTSPNTNVRDYGIPQKNNVARKQVYRDFYELTFTLEHNEDEYYQPLSNIVNFGIDSTENYTPHSAIFKLTYDEEVNGATEYYYTLESTVFKMKKAVYEVIEFKDNNIIGYDAQNTNTGFAISRVFSGTYEQMNVPISYTDSKGRFAGIDINFCTPTQVQNIYSAYKNSTAYADNTTIPFQNYLLFLPQEVYDLSNQSNRHDFKITDLTFNKDALEVPVIEYCCQIDDTPDVEIGQDILENEDAMVVIYDFVIVDKNTATQLNAKKFFRRLEHAGDTYTDPDGVYDSIMELYSRDAQITIGQDNKTMTIKFYYYQVLTYLFNQEQTALLLESRVSSDQTQMSALKDKDIVIYKHLVKSISYDPNSDESYCDYNDKLVMIIHGPTEDNFNGNDLILKINHYKLN